MNVPVTPLRPKATLSALDAQRLLDALPSAAAVFGPEGEIAAANLRAEQLLAAPVAAVIGHAPDGAFRLFRERAERIGTAEHARFVQPFGSLWYLVESFPLTVGKQTLRAVMATDITDMKSAEFEIRESEARLEEATRIAQLGTYKLYWDTGKMHWSPQVYAIHGMPPGGIVTLERYRDMIHPDDRELYDRTQQNQIDGKPVRGVEFRIIRKDGAVRWLRKDARVLFDSDGEPYATFGTCQDITEAKQHEQELKSLLRRNTILYEALDASPIGVGVVTTDGESPEFFYVNAEFERLTGHNTSSLSERGIETLTPEGQLGAGWARVVQTLRASVSGAFELTCLRRDGGQFLAQIEIAPVRDHPGRDATVFVLNLRDITVDRQRAESLLQSQKMEALGQLSGGVAHEINNLLQPMLALSDLGRDIADKDPAKVRKYFEVIASSGRKARDVVRQVLTFARRDAPQLAPYPIADLVGDALHLLHSGLPPGIHLNQTLDCGDARAVVNPTQVSQVVLNLVTNAADAMDGEGEVMVTLGEIELDQPTAAPLTLTAGRWIRLAVSDKGCGMDPYTLSRIFEPFFTTKLAGRGTGLGLSVVYSIVAGWGGALKVDSEVDKGTTAMVYIPVATDG
ncbi:MAG: PAS domain S-box protein [Rhodospirillaceae bacterium]|nr:PAS domain S-box protein [Rhodospirillaceae bacterium]